MLRSFIFINFVPIGQKMGRKIRQPADGGSSYSASRRIRRAKQKKLFPVKAELQIQLHQFFEFFFAVQSSCDIDPVPQIQQVFG
jgi:hypothetical protein